MDSKAFEQLTVIYNHAVSQAKAKEELAFVFGELVENFSPSELENDLERFIEFGEVVEILGPETLAEAYQDVLSREHD